jgi:hypothetical protein
MLPVGSVSRHMAKGMWEQLPDDNIFERFGMYTGNYESASTEADARAKMLVYLLENKLIRD